MNSGSSGFVTTRWTCVFQARGESAAARAALNELCTAYYAPVQAFLRHSARRGESADDLTHDFFARVLTGSAFDRVDPQRGRFRSYLLGAVKHFLADTRDREQALKRGAKVIHLCLDAGTDSSQGFDIADPASATPDAVFQRQWAMTVLDRALRRLQSEMETANKAEQFEILKPWLIGGMTESQSAAAQLLGVNENAVKVAIHRLRRRFRDLVTAEISQTLLDPADEQAELNDLIAALSL